MIVLENVTKRYGKTCVLNGITCAIQPNEFVCITGPSGAGKSTLIHLLLGAEAVTSGNISVDGVDLRKVPKRALQIYRRRVGMVFQDFKLLWNRTVAENIAFPLEICGAKDDVIKARTDELLEYMNLTAQAQTLCHELSGGEKARTAIARSIVHKPMIILADEPTGNLDPHESLNIMKLFKGLHDEGTTIVLATHDTFLVNALKTRVIRLENGSIVRDSVGSYIHENEEEIENGKLRMENDADESVKNDLETQNEHVTISAV